MRRRQYLHSVSALSFTLIAGCSDTSTAGDDSTPIHEPAEELLPTVGDFENAGWTASEIYTDKSALMDFEYASRSFSNDPDAFYFDVWVYDSVEAAKSRYNNKVNGLAENRSTEAAEIGVEGVAYKYEYSIVYFRDANVIGWVDHRDNRDGRIQAAKARAAMMHRV
jgi:hypothetical protein